MNYKYVASIAALVVIGLGVLWYQKNYQPTPVTRTEETAPTPAPSPAASKTAKKPAASQLFTYEETVERYVNQRMQFDANCLANPTSVTFKSGTQVMFDNRTNEKRTISLDGTGYIIGPYGYIILPLSSKTLPHTVQVDCGAQKNVAQILLQK